MTVPEHLWRFPTAEAIDSLAARFNLPNHPDMQDWEFEVADPSRIPEFLAAYESGHLSEDEKFTLMETMIQSFEDHDAALRHDARFSRLLELLDANIVLHAHSVWYWSALETVDLNDCWRVTPFMRRILEKHRERLATAP